MKSSSINFAVTTLLTAVMSVLRANVDGFAIPGLNIQLWQRNVGFELHSVSRDDDDDASEWMKRGLLISSFCDGVLNNPSAQEFLIDSISQAMWADQRQCAEQVLHDSAVQSPCCGPDMAAMEALEYIDQAMALSKIPNSQLRFIYVPTAMYAIRSDSQNTPGKQRQRARADAKQRRTTISQFLRERFGHQVQVLSVTLDFDDGSIKQTEGSSNANDFPKNGMDALQLWAPHFIYVEGGNTFWLHYCMKKGEWDPVLKKACRRAVYCGKSAGSILAGYSVETACWKGWDDPSIIPGMSEYSDWKGVRGLGLVGKTSIFPHMAAKWEERVAQHLLSKELGEVCCLTDQQACCVDGTAKRFDVISSTY